MKIILTTQTNQKVREIVKEELGNELLDSKKKDYKYYDKPRKEYCLKLKKRAENLVRACEHGDGGIIDDYMEEIYNTYDKYFRVRTDSSMDKDR